jgi:hypothetical protein
LIPVLIEKTAEDAEDAEEERKAPEAINNAASER